MDPNARTEEFGVDIPALHRGSAGRGRAGSLSAHIWEHWRLAAIIFSFSFLIQGLVVISLFHITFLNSFIGSPPAAALADVDSKVVDLYYSGSASAVPIGSSVANESHTSQVQECKRRRDEVPLVRSLQPLSFALYPYVKFSTYRLSLKTFFVVGITSQVARAYEQPVYTCQWQQGKEDVIITRAEMIYIRWDENRMPYAPAIVNCTFPRDVGEDGRGGRLLLQVTVKPKRDSPTQSVMAEVHEEKRGEVEEFVLNSQKQETAAAFRYQYAFCGPPIFGRIKADWILTWLTYHYRMYGGNEGKVHFFFYNAGGMNEESKKVLQPFVTAGLVEIVDVLDESMFPAHYHNQVLFINDCLQRSRFLARWTFFHDIDEFLHIPPPNSLESLLEQHADKPWLTFSSLPASYEYCTPPSNSNAFGRELWPMERMRWVTLQPECRNKDETDPWMCTGPLGRRKYVVNPRKVMASGVHVVTIVASPPDWHESGPRGVDLKGTIGRVHHYRGALAANRWFCHQTVNFSGSIGDSSSNVEGWKYDDSIALAIGEARELLAPLLRNT